MTDIGGGGGDLARIGKSLIEGFQEARDETTLDLIQDRDAAKTALKHTQARTRTPPRSELKKIKAQLKKAGKVKSAVDEKQKLSPVQQRRDDAANEFSGKNPELKKDLLLELAEDIKPGDTAEQIIEKVMSGGRFPNAWLARGALEFLAKVNDPPLKTTIEEAITILENKYPQEIRAGKNTVDTVREYATQPTFAKRAEKEGITPENLLRKDYNETVTSQLRVTDLYKKYQAEYPKRKDRNLAIKFTIHAVGDDLKSKSSIEPGKLHAVIQTTKSLQAILGMERFFKNRIPLVKKLFAQNNLTFPPDLNFEKFTGQFVEILDNRHLTSQALKGTVQALGIALTTALDKVNAEIIIIEQFRDAIPNADNKRIDALARRKEEIQNVIKVTLELLYELQDELEEALFNQEKGAA